MIRYFCVAGTGHAGDLSYKYLLALRDTGRDLRALAIGTAVLAGRWAKNARLFATEIRQPFVNVVCAPTGMQLGTRVGSRHMALAGNVPPELREVIGDAGNHQEEIVYEPQTALSGLYTVSCKNVAITWVHPKPPDENEIAHLRKYDAIICPTPEDTLALRALGLEALYMEPDSAQLTQLLGDLCGFVTTVTTEGPPATPRRPTTTSSPSTRKPTLKSKSSRSVTARIHQGRGTSLWRASSRATLALIRRISRFITRNLLFWRSTTSPKKRPPKK
jgi:hypothetical protein